MVIDLPGYVLFQDYFISGKYVIFKGIRESDQKPVLVKTIHAERPTLEEISTLKNEYELVHKIDDKEIAQPLLLDKYLHHFFLVFEDRGYETLSKAINSHHYDFKKKLKIAISITKALWTMQKHMIIHKDLQPNNILINPETLDVCLTGFGIATKVVRQKTASTVPSQLEGSLAYISPEQTGRMNRDIDYRTDYYSLGVVFYELFCEVMPFTTQDAIELIHAHIALLPTSPAQLDPTIPLPISDIIMKLLSKSAIDRYSSTKSLLADLEYAYQQLVEKGNITPFPLAQNDVSATFQISQKLYGRQNELEELTKLVESLPGSPPHLCLVGGYSGIGKSSLILEMQKPVIEIGGFFISGKFDQFKTNIPYSAFIQALQDLIQHILTESEDKIDYWKGKIDRALGNNASVITNVLPELKLIIGEPQKVQSLDTEQTYNRFSILFQQFITSFASSETPLFIFLDDLQWIDTASQKLIEMLMTSYQTRGLLILGAYRSNETDRYHPLKLLIKNISETNHERISELEVSALDLDQVTALISDSLHRSIEDSLDLAKVVFEKTQGNPFFINQLLTYLYDERLLFFDINKDEWSWDINKVYEAKISENIVTLLINRLHKCNEQTQEILMLASCIGNDFDIDMLSRISNYTPEKLLEHLEEAIEEGLVTPEGENHDDSLLKRRLKFPHDRVQQAVYSLVSPEKRKQEHLKIGRILIKTTPTAELEENIFHIVYQINNALELIHDPGERVKYSRYNLIAGERAMNSVAYRTALDHLKIGLSLLPQNPPEEKWEKNYDLAFKLELLLAECAFLTADYEEADMLFNHTLEMAHTDKEKISIYILKIKLFISTTKYDAAIQNGKLALKLLGIELPQNVSKWDILKELVQVKYKLLWHTPSSLLALPEVNDERKDSIINILFILIAPSYLSAKELYALISLLGTKLSLNWGLSPFSSYFFCAYGIIMNIIFGDLKTLQKFGLLSLELCQRFTNQISVPATKFLVGAFVIPYCKHIKFSIEVLKSSFETGIVVGDFIYGVYSLAQMMSNQYISSKNLDEMNVDLLEYREFVQKVKAHNRGYMFVGAQQTIMALKGQTKAPWLMDSENFSENEFFRNLAENNFPLSLYFIYTFKMQLLFLFSKYEETQKVGNLAADINYAVRGHPINSERDFYYALAITQKSTPPTNAEKKELHKIIKIFKNSDAVCPENFRHKYFLIKAEMARLDGETNLAIEHYDKAIESAKENDYIQYASIANELFAKFWFSQNKQVLAKQYLIEAHYGYYCWGATAKVQDLEEKYPHILLKNKNTFLELNTSGSQIEENSNAGSFDMASVVKAFESLSRELNYDVLIRDLMKILIENAGAERALLILDKGGKWQIEAEESGGTFQLYDNTPLDKSSPLIATSVIYYVLRTKESLVLDNAAKKGLFTTDSYVLAKSSQSIMALPLMHQGKLIGALWLENNLTTNAFTPKRVEVLKLLSSQIANSIENARLYTNQANLSRELKVSNSKLEDYSQNLEKKVYTRTYELKEKNEELQGTLQQIKEMQKMLVQQEKLVSLGAITKSIASEVRNPLGYIYNFAELGKDLLQDLNENGEDTQKVHEQVKENLQKIHEHAKKADEIITRMLEESRTTDLTYEATNINKLIRDYADLVYYNYYKKDPLFVLSIETHWDKTIGEIKIIPQNIGRVIYSIVDNACYSTDHKKKESPQDYSPTLSIKTENHADHIVIKIRDNGQGIAEDILSKIFTPYTTTKPSGKGAGMGLSLAKDIIMQEHEGTIDITSEVGQWTEVTLMLPKRD